MHMPQCNAGMLKVCIRAVAVETSRAFSLVQHRAVCDGHRIVNSTFQVVQPCPTSCCLGFHSSPSCLHRKSMAYIGRWLI